MRFAVGERCNPAASGGVFTFTRSGARVRFQSVDCGLTWGIAAMSSSDLVINSVKLTQVPEPTTTALLGLGGLALILRRRK